MKVFYIWKISHTFGVVCISLVFFVFFNYYMVSQFSSKRHQEDLEASKSVFVLQGWDMDVEVCSDGTLQSCSDFGSYTDVYIGNTQSTRDIFSKLAEEHSFTLPSVYNLIFRKTIDAQTLEWLDIHRENVHLVIPEFAAFYVRMLLPQTSPWQQGQDEKDFFAPLGQEYSLGDEIRIQAVAVVSQEFVASSSENFPVLTRSRHIYDYFAISKIDSYAGALQRNMVMMFPVVMAFLTIIIDYMKILILVACLSLLYTGAIFFSNSFEVSSLTGDTFMIFLVLMYAFIPVLYIKISTYLVNFSFRRYVWYIFSGLSVGINISWYTFSSKSLYFRNGDVWNLFVGLLVAFVIATLGVCFFRGKTSQSSQESQGKVSEGWKKIGFVISGIIFFVVLLATAALLLESYLQDHHKEELSSLVAVVDWIHTYLYWGHSMIIPCLLLVSLIHVGSIVRTIKRISEAVKEKAMLDRDIEIGKQLQSELLPGKKYQTDTYRWHAFYYPADDLAGDWYDLKHISTLDGRELLLGCVVDVTGHGIPSAMMTSNIASHWSLWAESVKGMKFSDSHPERETLLAAAPRQVHRGLMGLRYNLGCSMAAFIYEPMTRMFTYVTAGHPGIILSSGNTFRYFVSKSGTRPGLDSDYAFWQAHSLTLAEEPQYLCLYSDGLLEDGTALGTWLKRIQRHSKKQQTSPISYMMTQMRNNRKFYAKHPEKEDDITVIVVGLMWKDKKHQPAM